MAIVISKRLLTVNEAAEYLSISRAKLYRKAREGAIPSLEIDGCRRFDVLALDDWLDRLSANSGKFTSTKQGSKDK